MILGTARYRSGEIANWGNQNFNELFLCKYKRGFFFEWRIAGRIKKIYWTELRIVNYTETFVIPAGVEEYSIKPFGKLR